MNSFHILSSFLDVSGKLVLKELGFGYMFSPIVTYTSRIIMQAIPARVIGLSVSTKDIVVQDRVQKESIYI